MAIFAFDQTDPHAVVAHGTRIYEMQWDEDVSIVPEERRNGYKSVNEVMVAAFRCLDSPR